MVMIDRSHQTVSLKFKIRALDVSPFLVPVTKMAGTKGQHRQGRFDRAFHSINGDYQG